MVVQAGTGALLGLLISNTLVLLTYSPAQLKSLEKNDFCRVSETVYKTLIDNKICGVYKTHRGSKGHSRKFKFPLLFKKIDIDKDSTLHLGLLNARSVKTSCPGNDKANDICDLIVDNNLDILTITETWLRDGNVDHLAKSKIVPAGYKLIHITRHEKRGGGCAVVLRETIACKNNVGQTSQVSFEVLSLRINVCNQELLLNVVYRPPNPALFDTFCSEFDEVSDNWNIAPGKLLVCGDFNLHMDKETDSHASRFRALLQRKSLIQHTLFPTHKNGHILDLLITRSNELHFWNFQYDHSVKSDHACIMATVNVPKPPKPRKTVVCRKWKDIDVNLFTKDLHTASSAIVDATSDDIASSVEDYNSKLTEILDHHAPPKTSQTTVRHRTAWYTDDIRKAKQYRRKLERQMRRTRLTIHKHMHSVQRDTVNRLVEEAKVNHFTNAINSATSQKDVFNIGNSLLFRKKQSPLPSHTSTEELAETFNNFFSTKILKIRSALEETRLNTQDTPTDTDQSPTQATECELSSFLPATDSEITTIVKKCPTKSCASDPIPTWLLKLGIADIVPALTKIVNLSMMKGDFPGPLKEALITPILKKTSLDPDILKNYRPISNLPFISKLVERVVSSRLQDHMTLHNLGEPMQSAYKSNHSTESALLRVQNDLLCEVDSKGAAVLVLLDLSAAFDTIDHGILLSLLETRIGVKGCALAWFKSYLMDRHQTVLVSGSKSSRHLLQFGVPQGSVLGPLLFTVYTLPVGDIARRHNRSFHLYADDTQIYLGFRPLVPSSTTDAFQSISACIEDIRRWMAQNYLKLNDDKTELLVISSRNMIPRMCIPDLQIGECAVQRSDKARNLGVIFQTSLGMDEHTDAVCRTAYFHLRNIGQIRRYIGTEATKTLIHAFVTSRLDYCNALLYGSSQQCIAKLQRVQNSAARLICGTSRHEHVTPILKELHWIPVQFRIEYKVLVFVFKTLHHQAPSYLEDLITKYEPTRSLRSAASLQLTVPRTRTVLFGDRCFAKSGPILWNKLPQNIQEITDLETFKCEIKTLLFKRAYDLRL